MEKYKVITYNMSGDKSKFTNKDLKEMTSNTKMFYMADNLPKWIASRDMKKHQKGYDHSYKLVIRRIRRWIKTNKTIIIKFYADEYEITFKSANTGSRSKPVVKRRKSIKLNNKQKLLYNLSLSISGYDDSDAGDSEYYFDTKPKLKRALKFLVKKGGFNTKEINEGLKVYKKYKLNSDSLWDISLEAEDEEYESIEDLFGINGAEADALKDLANGLSWFDNYDVLLREAKKKGWKGK